MHCYNGERVGKSEARKRDRNSRTGKSETENQIQEEINTNDSPIVPKGTKQRKRASGYEPLMEIYNANKPKAWASCQTINEVRKRKLKKLHDEHGENFAQTLVDALLYCQTDSFWNGAGKDFNIDTLLRENRVVEFAEKYANKSNGNGSSKNAAQAEYERLMNRRQQQREKF